LTGTNWGEVSELLADGDTSYVYSQTVNTEDCYTLGALNASEVFGVQVVAYARKDAAGTRSLELGVGNNTTESFASEQALITSYVFFRALFDSNPFTSSAWSVSNFTGAGAIQAAVQISS
jgi:hypothetical protein